MRSSMQHLEAANPITEADAAAWMASADAEGVRASLDEPVLFLAANAAPRPSRVRPLALVSAVAATVLLVVMWTVASRSASDQIDVSPTAPQDVVLGEHMVWSPPQPAPSAEAAAAEFTSSVLGLDLPVETEGEPVGPQTWTVVGRPDLQMLFMPHSSHGWVLIQVGQPGEGQPTGFIAPESGAMSVAADPSAVSGVVYVRVGPDTLRIPFGEPELLNSTVPLGLSVGEEPCSWLVLQYDEAGELRSADGGHTCSDDPPLTPDQALDVAIANVLELHGDMFAVADTNLGTNGRAWFIEVVGVDSECLAYEVVGVGPEADPEIAPDVTGETFACVDS